MAAKKSVQERQKQKQAKQKKLLMLLIPVLLIAAGLQLPKLLGGSDEPEASSTDAAETAPSDSDQPAGEAGGAATGDEDTQAPSVPAPDPAAPVPASGLPLDVTVVIDLAEIPDSDPVFPADEGQLVSFNLFIGDDPFVQLVEVSDVQEDEEQPSEEASGAGGGGETPSAPAAETEIGIAILQINGELETVELDGTFPAEDPAFRLVSIGARQIEFGLVEGSFSSGVETLDLDLGKSITLISQPDGFRFTIELVAFPAETITEETITE